MALGDCGEGGAEEGVERESCQKSLRAQAPLWRSIVLKCSTKDVWVQRHRTLQFLDLQRAAPSKNMLGPLHHPKQDSRAIR